MPDEDATVAERNTMRKMLRAMSFRLPLLSVLAMLAMPALPVAAQDDRSIPVVYRVPGMDSVRVQERIVYKKADGIDLAMDVALPADAALAGPRPVILFIHGGPLGRGVDRPPTSWGVYRSYIRLAAAQGFVGVSFNFRYYDMTPEGLARAASDVSDAVGYVQANATKFGADPRRICLWTFSGGGPFLALGMRGPLEGIRCLVSYYALLDAGAGNADYSPVSLALPPGRVMPPLFIGRAGLDSPEINKSVESIVARALSSGFVVTLASHPIGRHGFDILDDDDTSREIIASTFEFVRVHTDGGAVQAETRLAPRLAEIYESLLAGDTPRASRLVEPSAWPSGDAALLRRVTSDNVPLRIAFAQIRGGEVERAVRVLGWLAERYPTSPTTLNTIAMAYERAGRREDARKASETVLRLLAQEKALAPETKAALQKDSAARLERLSK